MKNLAGRVAVITGAGSGIGRELAYNLAAQQCRLALADIDQKGLKETADKLTEQGVEVLTKTLDVSDREAVYAFADEVYKHFGQVNLVFNNAGVALGATVDNMSYEDFEWLMGINFWGVVYGTKAFLPYLKESGEGHIINVSSIFGLIGVPTQSAYNAAKFAVRGFTESLRQELEIENCGVSCTSIHPGGIKTNIARNARMNDEIEAITGTDAKQSAADFEKMFRTTPEQAAKTIIKGVKHNSRRVLIGADAHVVDSLQRLLPTSYQALMANGQKMLLKRKK